METLEGTSWDVLISGTGIQQSLLALALSRCGKKILHVDKNDVYGGSEAALSLQEADQFVDTVNSPTCRSPFSHASVTRLDGGDTASKLGPSRSYSLSLAPTLLYTRSALLQILVSSRAHEQIEFQAVGSWFVYGQTSTDESGDGESAAETQSRLTRVPNGREDIFSDSSLSLKAKGSLMKFLRFVGAYEEKPEIWESHKDMPFPDFLSQRFNLPPALHGPFLALTLSSNASQATLTSFALPRIARHLRSIGIFGPGFSAVIPKWGGLSEIAQVACRAGAVGGAVYVLGKGLDLVEENDIEEVPRPELSQQDISQEVSDAIGANDFLPTDEASLETLETEIKDQSLDELLAAAGYTIDSNDSKPAESGPAPEEPSVSASSEKRAFSVHLEGGEHVTADYVVGTANDLPEDLSGGLDPSAPVSSTQPTVASRCISIISASLPALYPPTSEGGVTPAGAVVIFPSGSLEGASSTTPPVHIIAHSSDTGECPKGQTVLYASISLTGDEAFSFLDQAVKRLLATQEPDAKVLWAFQYQQVSKPVSPGADATRNAQILQFPDPPLDLAFDDTILDNVKEAWLKITGDDADTFMKFEDRAAAFGEDLEDDV